MLRFNFTKEEAKLMDKILNHQVNNSGSSFKDNVLEKKFEISKDALFALRSKIVQYHKNCEYIGHIMAEGKPLEYLDIDSRTKYFLGKGGFSKIYEDYEDEIKKKEDKNNAEIRHLKQKLKWYPWISAAAILGLLISILSLIL